jgi:hypothetical protein
MTRQYNGLNKKENKLKRQPDINQRTRQYNGLNKKEKNRRGNQT